MEALFWGCLALGIYPYAGYPVLAWLIASVRNRKVVSDPAFVPRVTVVISAYNEAVHIRETVLDKLQQDYPSHLLDVLVVSDGSDDGTDGILRGLCAEHPRAQYFRQTPRAGKTSALNLALQRAQGEIVVFADANSIYRPDTVRRLVANFADPSVGYVTGSMRYVNPDGSLVGDGCSAYMRYENWLRSVETRVGSIVGVDGGVDAVRRRLYQPMRADQLPDFVLPLRIIGQGARVVYEPGAILQEHALSTQSSEYRMRVRVALRALWAMWDERRLLGPVKDPLYAWQLWSHKLLRYLSFIPLTCAAIVNWLLWSRGGIYPLMAVTQVAMAVMIMAAATQMRGFGRASPARYCYYFFLLNLASAVAFTRFVRGQKQVLWQPRTG